MYILHHFVFQQNNPVDLLMLKCSCISVTVEIGKSCEEDWE